MPGCFFINSGLHFLANLPQGVFLQSGHLSLRDADLGGDLHLGFALKETHREVMDQVKDNKNNDEMWVERIALKEAVGHLTDRERKIH